jgi:hypothetical protein
MKIVFLDVDGVLTTSRCLFEDYEEDDTTLCFPRDLSLSLSDRPGLGPLFPLEISMIQNLKSLIEEVDAHIVISSTWRESEIMTEYLMNALESQGIPSGRVIGKTPFLGCLDGRGAEIQLWLNQNTWSSFVILDDDHMKSFQKFSLHERVVQTVMRDEDREKEGLSRERCERAISILSNTTI